MHTPERALDFRVLNRWLLYQTLSCRIWGRAGFLPARGRIWIPRSNSGLRGADGEPSGLGPCASDGWRQDGSFWRASAALVASADWPWRANALLR